MKFNYVTFKNFLSYGNNTTRFEFNDGQVTVIAGKNGHGKCLDKLTEIDIDFLTEETKSDFLLFLKENEYRCVCESILNGSFDENQYKINL